MPIQFAGKEENRFGSLQRVPWHDSRVVGSPEPPLPDQLKQPATTSDSAAKATNKRKNVRSGDMTALA